MRKKAKDTRMQKLTRWMAARYFPGMAIYKKVTRKAGVKRRKAVANADQG